MRRFRFIVTLLAVLFIVSGTAYSSSIEVDTQYDFSYALNYAFQTGIDSIILITSGGIYTTTDTVAMQLTKPLVIFAKPDLEEKPIFRHSDPDSGVLEIFRIQDDVTFDGVIFDGFNEVRPMKYGIRVGHAPDNMIPRTYVKEGLNITFKNCEFRNFNPIGWENSQGGTAFYFLRPETGEPVIKAGTVRIENCLFQNIGDEVIRIAETEKYNVTRCLDSLIVRNCTFKNCAAECVRFYADTDTSTEDAYVALEHITVDSSAIRVFYIKNNQNTICRNIIISNSIMPKPYRMDRSGYAIQVQQRGSFVSHIDTFNLKYGLEYANRIGATKGGTKDDATFYGFDPLYEDRTNDDYTLTAESPAYGLAHDGEALGDLRWATNTATRIPFMLTVVGDGTVEIDPAMIAPNYPSGTQVTMTAVPDTGWTFKGWSGDLTSMENPLVVTMDAPLSITATFEQGVDVAEGLQVIREYRLDQNYPNPFNPATTITFSLKKSGNVKMDLFNLLGQRVVRMVDQHFEASAHKVVFNAVNLPAGVYFYQLKSGEFTSVRKLILMK